MPLACVILIAPVTDSVVATCQCMPNDTISELIPQFDSAEMRVTYLDQWPNATWFQVKKSMGQRCVLQICYQVAAIADSVIATYQRLPNGTLSELILPIVATDCGLRDVSTIKKKMYWHLLSLRIWRLSSAAMRPAWQILHASNELISIFHSGWQWIHR